MNTAKDTTAEAVSENAAASPVDALLDRITVNEQSSIRIAADKIIYIDPFRLPDAPHDADLIFITHAHYDHFSPEDIEKIRRDDTVFVVPESMTADVKKIGVEDADIVALAPGSSAEILGFPVETVAAYNTNKQFHPKKNGWLGYILTVDSARVYIAGDTDDTEEARAVKCDIAMLPIGGTYTMTAEEARELAKALAPKAAIPTHYGTVVGKEADYDVFADSMANVVKKIQFGKY
ncbi:MAG: MBL fold metallo-hydrolase [Clostridia bacterium]|nr:MBL fold metallo-hydrolase [Clostridia bacterium]